MKAVSAWILVNPQAFKAYLLSLLALIAKLILAFTGKAADLGQWSGFVDQATDLLVGGLTIYGVIAGSVHAAQGPALSSSAQASVIIAALAPAPAAAAIETVKEITADVTGTALPPMPAPPVPKSHQF